ncbi:hypothetical protein [Mycobacterium sp.]|uniref:hypothetical protein n=1 Tax=Mycobacterium sp. TaxID=1785 RepID=UPI0031D3D667
MTVYVISLAAVAIGLAIGAGAMTAARRSAQTRGQSVRRQRIVLGGTSIIVATILLVDATGTASHRYVNLALIALMVAGWVFDWVRGRRRSSL